MTKITKAPPAEPSEAMVHIHPDTITIVDGLHMAWPVACALIRMGWAINPDMPPEPFIGTGKVSITLVRSKFDAEMAVIAMEYASESEELAAANHAVAYLRDVQAAAIVAVETAKKAEAAALMTAQIESQRQALAALEAAAKAVA